MKKAVDCGYWDMFRYNPALKAEGKNPFALDSKPATADYKDFIMGDMREMDLFTLFSSPKYIAMRQSLTPHTPKCGHCATCTADTSAMSLDLLSTECGL